MDLRILVVKEQSLRNALVLMESPSRQISGFAKSRCSKYTFIPSNAGTCGDAVPDCECPDGKTFKPPQDLVADAVMEYNAQYN
jgi:hypothetical protein